MTWNAFDPRTNLISSIGYRYDFNFDDIDESCVSVTYPSLGKKGDTCYIPMFQPDEVRTGELPIFPFIEITLVSSPKQTHNIGGDTHLRECYFDFNLYIVDNDYITVKEMAPLIRSEIANRIATYRASVSKCTFVEVINDGREIIESYDGGKQKVFHYVMECYAIDYGYP